MEQVGEFLANNYIWFLVVTLILVLALIGYLSEDRKRKKELDPKEKVEKKSEEEKKPIEKLDVKMKNVSLSEAIKDNKNKKEEPKNEAFDTLLIEDENKEEKKFEE